MFARLGARRAIVSLGAAAVLAVSPFAPATIVDPLGVENFVSFLLLIAALGELASPWALAPPLFLLTLFLLGLQDLPLAFCVAVPALFFARWRQRREFVLWIATIVAVLIVRAVAGEFVLHAAAWYQVSAVAIPVTIVIFGAMLFGVLPVALYAGRAGAYGSLEIRDRNAFAPAAAGVGCVAAGLFATSGDPAFYWFCASAAFLAAALLALVAPVSIRVLQGAIAASIVAEVLGGAWLYGWMVNATIARESAELHELMNGEKAGAGFCLTGSDAERLRVLAGGALLRTYGKPGDTFTLVDGPEICLRDASRYAAFVNLENRYATEWKALGFSLQSAKMALVRFSVPKANRAGKGAFTNLVDSPLGLQPAFTVVAGSALTVPCRSEWAHRHLSFAAGDPIAGYPGATPARFRVVAKSAARRTIIAEDTFYPAEGPTHWRFYRIPIPRTEKCATLAFGVTAPTGRAIATWVTFVNAAVR